MDPDLNTERRLSAVEELLADLQTALKKYAARARQAELLPAGAVAAVDGSSLVGLRDALVECFQMVMGSKYVFDGAKDAAAVKRLVCLNTTRDDVVARWEECLRSKWGPRSIAAFAARVNDFPGKTKNVHAVPLATDPYAK